MDEALCFGWIDSVRQSIDDESYMNRFTPRKPDSNWSAVNVRRVGELTKQRRMRAAGLKAFRERREDKTADLLVRATAPGEARTGASSGASARRRRRGAGSRPNPTGYRATARYWVMSAKKPETRERRLDTLIEDSAKVGGSRRSDPGRGRQ